MPKPTFFNLPKEKQEILIHSAKKEFSRVPLNEASISNIVKNADIPRGSFYQYFEDKEDAFYYLLELQTKVQNNEFIFILKENKGDVFETFIETFESMLTDFQEQENRDFFKNAFLNMNYKMERKLAKGFRHNKDNFDKKLSDIYMHIDTDKLNISNDEELVHVMQIIIAVTFHNLINNFADNNTFEEALANYQFEINLLKKGLYKTPSPS